MKTPATAKSDPAVMETFSILIAYEDMLTHNRVREVCDRLLDRFWEEVEFDFNWWSFRSLNNEASAKTAAAFAAKAHLIVMASHARPALPPHIQNWLESWVPARTELEGALAALIGIPEEKGAAPILGYLMQIAERARLEFLPKATSAALAPKKNLKRRVLSRKRRITEDLRRLLDPRRPPSHWGINE